MISHFAGRRTAGTEYPVTISKDGVRHVQRLPDGSHREVLAVGLACSECFSGANLYKVLKPGLEYEMEVMKKLANNEPAPPLAIHTSSGVPEPLEGFIEALEVHLPWKNKKDLDWCVSLQCEGASAVWAAVDMVLQVQIFETKRSDRLQVAVGATSYHGPPSTSFGAKTPLWHKHHQVVYPVPTAFGQYDEEELIAKYKVFLDEHGADVGVMLIEPQWGSSQAGLPWPEHLLKLYIKLAKERGIRVVCDEIMCGLGRHGKGTLFVAEAWGLDVDAITFGKAIATGAYPLSGAILKRGRNILQAKKCSVMQSHTYAGSSTRALMAATQVLKEFVTWLPSIARLGKEMEMIMGHITKMSDGMFICNGQGLMWGGVVSFDGQNADPAFRANVVKVWKENCELVGIIPYHVPVGGFMVSPVIDIDLETVLEIGKKMEEAVRMTMDKVGWALPNDLSETSSVDSTSTPIAADPRMVRSIASASTLNLADFGRTQRAQSMRPSQSFELLKDLGNDRLVPMLDATIVEGKVFHK